MNDEDISGNLKIQDYTNNSNLEEDSNTLGKDRKPITKKGGQLGDYTMVQQNFNDEPSSINSNSSYRNPNINDSSDSKNSKDSEKEEEKKKKNKNEKKDKHKETNKKTLEFKVILLGSVSVGKTSIADRFINNYFKENYKCTIQAEQRAKIINEDSNTVIKLNIWDTTGQEKFRSLTRQFYRDTDGAIIVFDLTSKQSFEQLSDWIEDLKSYGPGDAEIIIIGNKSDLVNERVIPQEDIISFVKDDYSYFEVSAKNGNNISLAFDKIKELMMENKKRKDKQEQQKKNKNDEDNKKNKSKRVSREGRYLTNTLEINKNVYNENNNKCC